MGDEIVVYDVNSFHTRIQDRKESEREERGDELMICDVNAVCTRQVQCQKRRRWVMKLMIYE